MRTKISGIYLIFNRINKKKYVGSARDIYGRWNLHKSTLDRNTHHNILLKRAWHKYGEEAFKFSIIEKVSELKNLRDREQFWMDKLEVCNRKKGYNMCPLACSTSGRECSSETREKLSKVHKGKKQAPRSKEHCKKIADANRGKKWTSEQKERLKLIRNSRSDEEKRKTGEKISINNTGRKMSAESIEKTRVAKIGKPRSEETKRKISEKNKGRKISPESIQKREESRKKNKELKLLGKLECS